MQELSTETDTPYSVYTYIGYHDGMAVKKRQVRRTPRRANPGRRIDFSDIPELTPAELASMKRVGRPPLGAAARQLIAIRVDAGVLEQFRKEARRRGIGYQTLMHEVLAKHAAKGAA